MELAGTFKAKVNTEGWTDQFDAAAPLTQEGSVDVVCQTGKEVNVEVEGIEALFLFKIPAQTGLKTVEYVNQGTCSTAKTKVNASSHRQSSGAPRGPVAEQIRPHQRRY